MIILPNRTLFSLGSSPFFSYFDVIYVLALYVWANRVQMNIAAKWDSFSFSALDVGREIEDSSVVKWTSDTRPIYHPSCLFPRKSLKILSAECWQLNTRFFVSDCIRMQQQRSAYLCFNYKCMDAIQRYLDKKLSLPILFAVRTDRKSITTEPVKKRCALWACFKLQETGWRRMTRIGVVNVIFFLTVQVLSWLPVGLGDQTLDGPHKPLWTAGAGWCW